MDGHAPTNENFRLFYDRFGLLLDRLLLDTLILRALRGSVAQLGHLESVIHLALHNDFTMHG